MLDNQKYNNDNEVTTDYDYIICGAGCAGISLLLRILKEPKLQDKSILIIDSDLKQNNDRTWCFWEDKIGFFDHLVFHKWSTLNLYTDKNNLKLNISPFSYKMIRSIDFYSYAKHIIAKHKNISWKQANLSDAGSLNDTAYIMADGLRITAKYVFNSIMLDDTKLKFKHDKCYKLLQHFKGWLIETKQPIFNHSEATFMDFRVSQDKGAAFVYVLPISSTRALVEYTFFNKYVLNQSSYDELLENYLEIHLRLNRSDYFKIETEFGVIPMTNHQFNANTGNVINIGTNGGWTKPSSGFTFQFIQKNSDVLVAKLKLDKRPVLEKNLKIAKYNFYDSTLLNILYYNKLGASEIFFNLFLKNKSRVILQFLDNETTLFEDIKIMNTVKLGIFLPSAIKQLVKSVLKNLI